MRHSSLCFSLLVPLVQFPVPLAAQANPEPRTLCWRGAPKPACRVVVLTDFGLYASFGSSERFGGRVTGDWGLLFNLGSRNAVGASVLGSAETTEYSTEADLSLFLRYRRWLGGERSLDLGLGVPVRVRNSSTLRSPYGLVKLNLNDWVGVAVRPELRRTLDFSGVPTPRSRMFVSAGIEVGEKPGFALSTLGAIILGIRVLSLIGN